MKKVSWPPGSWDEMDLYRDPESRLPRRLYPFELDNDRDENNFPIDSYTLNFAPHDGRPAKPLGHYVGIFPAFRAMFDEFEKWYPTRPIEKVYFIGTELRIGAMLKIGYSLNPKARLNSLQTAHPERLSIFATTPGGKDVEEKYHRRWHARRKAGEWFVIGDVIIKEIERLRQAAQITPLSGGEGA